MCKIFMVAGVKESNSKRVWDLVKAIAKPMSRFDDDGLGYSAITADGKLFGERWLNNNHAFKKEEEIADKRLSDVFGKAIDTKETNDFVYNSFGDVDPGKAVAITLHTRSATSPKGMNNTHPFVKDGVSLIHNGVIRNEKDFTLELSTCDSEAILISYLEKKVIESVTNSQAMADMLRGYYACGVLTNTEQGPTLDIFKSPGARLHVTYVEELETWIISTDDGHIKDTCKELGFTTGKIFSMLPGKFIRVNAITGKEQSITDFSPTEYASTSHHYPYAGGHQSNFQTGGQHTEKKALTTTAGSTTNVYPFGKSKKNTPIDPDLMAYYKAGRPTCMRLTEREVMEEIMEQERMLGTGMW